MATGTPGPNGQSPQTYAQARQDAGISPNTQTPADIINNPALLLQNILGVTPARLGKGMHQALVGAAGVLIIILGFVLIVSGTKTAQTIAKSAVKIGATVAA